MQQRLVKTGGRLVKHARYYWFLLAESHLTRRLFGAMLQRIWALPVPMGADGLTCSQRHGARLATKEHRDGDVPEKRPRTRSFPVSSPSRWTPLTVSGA